MYKVSLRKYRATWHYFTTNPQGGGFGSNHCGAKRVAYDLAIRNIPLGSQVEITTENNGRFVSRQTITR